MPNDPRATINVPCRHCGATVGVPVGSSATLCPVCDARVELDDEALGESQSGYPNPTPLRPGGTALFEGRRYACLARVVSSTLERGERRYSHDFLLVGETDQAEANQAEADQRAMLQYSEGRWRWLAGFSLESPLQPEVAATLRDDAPLVLGHGITGTVAGTARATVEYIEGELPYALQAGDKIRYLYAKAGTELYIVEARLDAVQAYAARDMTRAEVLAALGLEPAADPAVSRYGFGTRDLAYNPVAGAAFRRNVDSLIEVSTGFLAGAMGGAAGGVTGGAVALLILAVMDGATTKSVAGAGIAGAALGSVTCGILGTLSILLADDKRLHQGVLFRILFRSLGSSLGGVLGLNMLLCSPLTVATVLWLAVTALGFIGGARLGTGVADKLVQ